MNQLTNESSYDDDLQAATSLIQRFVNFADCDGNMRNWAVDALANEWRDGLTIEQWVAQALVRINHGQ